MYIHGGNEGAKQYWNVQNCETPIILYSESHNGCADGTNEFFRFNDGALTTSMHGADGHSIGPIPGSKDMQLGIVQSAAGTWAYDKASKRLSLNSTLCVASASAGPGPSPPGPSPGGGPEVWYKPLPGAHRQLPNIYHHHTVGSQYCFVVVRAGKAAAVALFNRGGSNTSMTVSFSELPALGAGVHTCVVDDVWEDSHSTVTQRVTYPEVRERQVVLLRIHDCK